MRKALILNVILHSLIPPFLQIINYGVILHKGAYFRDEWNFIDALVVSCAIASLVLRWVNHGTYSEISLKGTV